MAALLSVFVAVAIAGCGDHQPAPPMRKATNVDGLEQENAVRLAIGLRLVQDDWYLSRVEFGNHDWKAGPTVGHISKRVFKPGGSDPIWEEDYHYSGVKFEDGEGLWAEFVTVSYRYDSRRLRVSYFGTNQQIRSVLAPYQDFSDRVKEGLSAASSVVTNW